MRAIAWMFVLVAVIWWLVQARSVRASHVDRISGADARRLVANGAVLLDVRTPAEFASDHIEGAVLLPVQDVRAGADALPALDVPVVVYCRSGRRSALAAGRLESLGYESVYDLGPRSAW